MTKNRTPTPVYLDPGMHPGLEVKGLKNKEDNRVYHVAMAAEKHNYVMIQQTLNDQWPTIKPDECLVYVPITHQ